MTAPLQGAVLAPSDLSSQAVNAAWRAAVVARDIGAPLRLLHVQARATESAAAPATLRGLAREIEAHLGITVEVEVAAGDALERTVRSARDAALVVIGARPGNPLRALVLGTQAERLIRLCRVPVLVVRRPAAGSYRRVLVAAALGPDAQTAAVAASRLSRDPRIEVLHALDLRDEIAMRACDVPETVVRALRRRGAERARQTLRELLDGAQLAQALPAVGFGDPAQVVLARAQGLRADLLVIGKRMRGALADFLLGSVTQRVLASARADVLVLPVLRSAAPGGMRALQPAS